MKLNGDQIQCCLRAGNLFLSSLLLATAAQAAELSDSRRDTDAVPTIESEILEMALDQCRRGDAVQAQALFKAIKEQLDLPAPMIEIIASLEASGCQGTVASPPVRWGVQFGAGYDNNVNQGIFAQSMTLGSGINAVELELGDTYKPRASAYVVAGIDSIFRLGDFAVGQVALQHRDNRSVPELNLTSLVASAIRPFGWLDRPGRVQLDLGETWLGGVPYQRAESAGVQWLLMGGEQPWLASLTTLRTSYVNQPNQDNQLTEAGIWREKQLAPTLGFFGGLSALYDRALKQRPGGDRAGGRLQLGATTAMAEWLIQPRINVLRWASHDVFSPGLIDVARHQQLTVLDLQLVRPIAPSQQIVVEWRASNARDSVPLFSYRAQSVGVYWRLQR